MYYTEYMKKREVCLISLVLGLGVAVIITLGVIGVVSDIKKDLQCSVLKPEVDLPAPEVSGGMRGELGIDKNINEVTIDQYLGRSDAVYRDMRMLVDEANYEAIGGDSYLSGFVDGKYTANYAESMEILEYYFPKDKVIFLMCGGGGYAGMMKDLLVALGWDASKIYNVGGYWYYDGENNVQVKRDDGGETVYDFWKVPYHDIDFSILHAPKTVNGLTDYGGRIPTDGEGEEKFRDDCAHDNLSGGISTDDGGEGTGAGGEYDDLFLDGGRV